MDTPEEPRSGRSMKDLDPLRDALDALTIWLRVEGLEGVIIGGVAASLLGRPRATRDVDAMIWVEPNADLASLVERAARHGIVPRIDDVLGFAAESRVLLMRHAPSAIDLDLSLGALDFERAAIEQSSLKPFGSLRIPVPRPEDIVVMKAIAKSSGPTVGRRRTNGFAKTTAMLRSTRCRRRPQHRVVIALGLVGALFFALRMRRGEAASTSVEEQDARRRRSRLGGALGGEATAAERERAEAENAAIAARAKLSTEMRTRMLEALSHARRSAQVDDERPATQGASAKEQHAYGSLSPRYIRGRIDEIKPLIAECDEMR